MATEVKIEGIESVLKILDELPVSIGKNTIQAAGRKALKPAQREAKSYLKAQANSFKNDKNFSKLKYVAKNIRIKNSRNRKRPGVNMYVTGNDLPVGGRWWTVSGYARLLAFGSKSERFTRSNKESRGSFKGFEDFIWHGYKRTGGQVERVFLTSVRSELIKAVSKTVKRYGKRYGSYN